MDIITHSCLGACLGEIALGRQLGKKAVLLGVVLQDLPDADTLLSIFYPADRMLMIHRGISHSLFFALVGGIILARILPVQRAWWFCCGSLIIHDVLDCCNAYGTGFFEPFSENRVTFHLLYVADPLFSAAIAAVAIALVVLKMSPVRRRIFALSAVGASLLYLSGAVVSKIIVSRAIRHELAQQGLRPQRYFITPAPLTSMFWMIVAFKNDTCYTGYRSVFDRSGSAVKFEAHPQNFHLLKQIRETPRIRRLKRFAGNDFIIMPVGNQLFLGIVRFGLVQGWHVKNASFVFTYPLQGPDPGNALLQKGRLSGWNLSTFCQYLQRVSGRAVILTPRSGPVHLRDISLAKRSSLTLLSVQAP